MIRKINRAFQNFMRPKRLAIGKFIWDRKKESGKCSCQDIIEREKVKSILFMRYDGKIGDMVVNTMMFREVKRKFPDVKIGVVTKGAARDIIANNPFVNEIYNFDRDSGKMRRLAERIADEKYDLLVDFSEMLRVKEMEFIHRCKARINLGLDKSGWNLFDCSIEPGKDFRWDDHITARYGAYLKKMGIENYSTDYDVFINPERKEKVREYYENLRRENPECGKIAVLNPYGASRHKNFNFESLKKIAQSLSEKGYITTLVYSPDRYQELLSFAGSCGVKNLYIPDNIKSILDSAAMIEESNLVITPDTSIVHIGSAFDKRVISVYPPKGGIRGVDHLVWAPRDPKNRMLFCRDRELTGGEIDTNTFDMDEMEKEIDIKS